ncbi:MULTISPECIES: thrombospondin type 3 repeat-containing protein [Myxococcaceae]|uniref:thrombospondin type 3 repeat-containing protein n=1 Tax=Myxococcaceae TaxID=31 RepID=UPI00129D10AF|nr:MULTISPECIES: thrombospondin type 3 repeat-containing protein [Myxococcaceae]MBF5046234.1 hypothetical protein [Simulacricoccus sp. 17bor-14]
MSVRRRRALLPLLLLSLGASAGAAHATQNFPGAIRRELGLSYTPDCSLCHVGAQRVGTVKTPFGTSMRARGLVFYDESSLRTALSALRAERTDSDGDGVGDIDELIAGTDPNHAPGATSGGEEPPPPPTYGCSAAGAAAPLALLALLRLLRRR